MPELLTVFTGVACRTCGAVRGPRSESNNDGLELGVCENCWRAFNRWRDERTPATEDDFNRWLARKLFLDLRRLQQTGVVGRCEAVSDWMYGRRGQQCALPAMTRKDGHLVCGQHLSARNPAFVETTDPHQPYQMLEVIVSRLVKVDRRLLEVFSKAIGLDAAPAQKSKGGQHEHLIIQMGDP